MSGTAVVEIGRWLKVNGEGIYGSKVWRFAEERTIETKVARYDPTSRSNPTGEVPRRAAKFSIISWKIRRLKSQATF